jgi:hypothetical protein
MSYSLSTDYNLLFDLLEAGYEVVCFVDCHGCRDVCRARIVDGLVSISARGTEYGFCRQRNPRSVFIEDCEQLQLDFIEPNRGITATSSQRSKTQL